MEGTPFMLTYDLEAVLPIKVALHRHRLMFQESLNNSALQEALGLLHLFDVTPSFVRHSTNDERHRSMTYQSKYNPSI